MLITMGGEYWTTESKHRPSYLHILQEGSFVDAKSDRFYCVADFLGYRKEIMEELRQLISTVSSNAKRVVVH